MNRRITIVCVYVLLSLSVKDTTAQAGPGENCTTDSDCLNSATCTDNKCVCKPEYKPDTQLNMCRAGIGQPCYYDTHCILDAFCHGRISCMCDVGLEASNDNLSCMVPKDHGDVGLIAQITSAVSLFAMFVITRIIY